MNHLTMLLVALFCSVVKPVILPLQVEIGSWLLENMLFYNLFRLFDNLPLLPWLHLNRADILGALCLGLSLGSLLVALSFIVFSPIIRHGKQLILKVHWQKMMQTISRHLAGHLPRLPSLLQSKKFQELRHEYLQARKALLLAETAEDLNLGESHGSPTSFDR